MKNKDFRSKNNFTQEIQQQVERYKKTDAPLVLRRIEGDLYERFFRVASKVAARYKNNPMSSGRMVQAGMESFSQALRTYDLDKHADVPFRAYATRAIRSGIKNELTSNIGIKTHQQKCLFNKEARYRREAERENPGAAEEFLQYKIAEKFFNDRTKNGNPYVKTMDAATDQLTKYYAVKAMIPRSLNAYRSHHDGDAGDEFIDTLRDDNAINPEDHVISEASREIIRGLLANAFSKLTEREKIAVEGCLQISEDDNGNPAAQKGVVLVGEEFGVTHQRAHQIYSGGLAKLRKSIAVQARSMGLRDLAGFEMKIPEVKPRKKPAQADSADRSFEQG